LESQIIKNFGSNKFKGPKQESQNLLRSPMPEGGEPLFLLKITLFRNCKMSEDTIIYIHI
jgi:hypothetical protein